MSADELLAQYEATGDEEAFVEAKTLYEQALVESPDDVDLHMNYGYLLECNARNQLRQAVARYERAIELDPETLSPVYSSAFLLDREGRLEEAMDAWRTIIDWSETRKYTLDAVWPRQELERLHGAADETSEPPAR